MERGLGSKAKEFKRQSKRKESGRKTKRCILLSNPVIVYREKERK